MEDFDHAYGVLTHVSRLSRFYKHPRGSLQLQKPSSAKKKKAVEWALNKRAQKGPKLLGTYAHEFTT